MNKRSSVKKPLIITLTSLLVIGLLGLFLYICFMEHPVSESDAKKLDKALAVVTDNSAKSINDKDSFSVDTCDSTPLDDSSKDDKDSIKLVSVLKYLNETASKKTSTTFNLEKIKQLASNHYKDSVKQEIKTALENSVEIKAEDVSSLYFETYGETIKHTSVSSLFDGYIYDKDRDVYYGSNNNSKASETVSDILHDFGGIGCNRGSDYYVKERYAKSGKDYYLYASSYYLYDYFTKDGDYEDGKCAVYTDFEKSNNYDVYKKVDCTIGKDYSLDVDYVPSEEDLKTFPKYRFVFRKNGDNINFVKLEKL